MYKDLGRLAVAVGAVGGITAAAWLTAEPAVAQEIAQATPRTKSLVGRVNELEQELRIMKNRMKAMNARRARSVGSSGYVRNEEKKVKLEVSGQVNRAVLFSLTTGNTEIHHVDNDASSTRLRLKARAKGPGGWSIESRIEFEIENNPSDSTDDTDVTGRISRFALRKAWVGFKHRQWGRISLGREDSATNGIVEIDLSGTTVVHKSDVETMGGGLEHLAGNSTGPGTGTGRRSDLEAVTNNFDGVSRTDNIRYDTPKFWGFWLSVSHSNGDILSAALRFKGNPFGYKDILLAFGLGYDYIPGAQATAPGNSPGGPASQFGGSVSALHTPTGISLTFAASTRVSGGSNTVNPYLLYAKLGWQTKSLVSWGKTAFSVDAYLNKDVASTAAGGSESTGIGFAIVQKIDSAATELYVAYRAYFLEFGNDGYSTLHVIMTGARMKF